MGRIISIPLITLFSIFLFTPSVQAVDAQIEFTAVLESIDDSSDPAVLGLRLTPGFLIAVEVTSVTEIKSQEGEEIGLDDLEVGQTLEVEGVFTEGAIVALEIRVADEDVEFELRGPIESVDESTRTIVLYGFPILVPPEAEIKDREGNQLAFSELEPGQRVKVEGRVEEGQLIAREVRVLGVGDRPVSVRFRGVVTAIADEETIQVTIEGGIPVRVLITPETQIRGTLAVGVVVRVFGQLTPELAVEARRIVVQRLIQLAPSRLRMRTNQERRVVVILRDPFDRDVDLRLVSLRPGVAEPAPETLTIPAGRPTGFFMVRSGPAPGETVIEVALPEDLGGLSVELPVLVEARGSDDGEEDELEVRWRPDEIRSADEGFRDVRLELNEPAPTDLPVSIFLSEGAADQVAFPEQVVIPQGDRSALVRIEFLDLNAQARIRARLPDDVGGDTDDLEIDLRRSQQPRLTIRWRPDRVEVPLGTEVTIRLALNREAPEDFDVILSPRGGNSAAIEGLPSEVEFDEGETEVEVRFAAVARGTFRVRAALPLEFGGSHDDLRIEVR